MILSISASFQRTLHKNPHFPTNSLLKKMPTRCKCCRKQSERASLTATPASPAPKYKDAWQFAYVFSPQVEPIAVSRRSAGCTLHFCNSSQGEGGYAVTASNLSQTPSMLDLALSAFSQLLYCYITLLHAFAHLLYCYSFGPSSTLWVTVLFLIGRGSPLGTPS
jgi:hypothetical protein